VKPLRHVYRWDLDKTYLRTDFDSWRGLVRAALEKARDKVNVAGSAALLRELRRSGDVRLAIISGSPRQMRAVLEEKLRLDGIEWDELTLKPNVSNVFRGRFRAVRDQVGYKLPALLEARLRGPRDVPETLFGDDAECDAFVYSLYADVISGRVSGEELASIVRRSAAYEEDADRIVELAAQVPQAEAVRRIYIHLDGYTPTSRFASYGTRAVPIYNYFQAAVLLMIDGHLSAASVIRVAAEMVQGYGYSLMSLANSFQDLVRRGLARQEDVSALRLAFEAQSTVIQALRPAGDAIDAFLARLGMITGVKPSSGATGPIDYQAILDREGPPREWRHKRKARRKSPGPFED
jgi:hypothetical protein